MNKCESGVFWFLLLRFCSVWVECFLMRLAWAACGFFPYVLISKIFLPSSWRPFLKPWVGVSRFYCSSGTALWLPALCTVLTKKTLSCCVSPIVFINFPTYLKVLYLISESQFLKRWQVDGIFALKVCKYHTNITETKSYINSSSFYLIPELIGATKKVKLGLRCGIRVLCCILWTSDL